MKEKSVKEIILEGFKKDTWSIPIQDNDTTDYSKKVEKEKESSKVKNINIYGTNLTITIPRFTKRANPCEDDFGEDNDEMDNIIGLYEGEYENGLAYRIDMSYKGKADQTSDYFFRLDGSKKEFEEMIKKLSIDATYYEKCSECNKTIYGSCTWGDEGLLCFDCNKE